MSIWTKVLIGAVILLFDLLGPAMAEPKRVFLLHSFGSEFAPFSDLPGTLREELVRQWPGPLDLFEASLDMALFSDVDAQSPFADYLSALFAQRRVDLVVPIGGPAVSFIQRYRERLFPTTPMLFSGLEERRLQDTVLTANDAAVGLKVEQSSLIENILAVLPETNNVVVVVGDSPIEKFWLGEMRREFRPFTNRVTFTYFNKLSFEDILKKAASLPPRSAILLAIWHTDAAGVSRGSKGALSSLRSVANAPIFGVYDSSLGDGIVGGRLIPVSDLSRNAAGVAVRILRGETPGDIKAEPLGAGAPIYDWRELQRWNISEDRLPPGSEIRFREVSVWERYRWLILAVAAVVLLEGALILWLLSERRRRAAAQSESHRRLLEIAHLNRNADAGALSTSIAHELNQPLGAILSNSEALDTYLEAESPDLNQIREIVGDIRRDDLRAAEIIDRVRQFAKKQEPEPQEVDLNDIVRVVDKILAPEAKLRGIELRASLGERAVPVRGVPVHLQQVILNLALNGMDAIGERPAGNREMTIEAARNGNATAEVSVSDSGTSIPADNLASIFEPFFTTKQRGMGLGLSIVRQIVETYGGRIWAENRPTGGAVFRFTLPLAGATRNDRRPPSFTSSRLRTASLP
ncbi:His Kinase A (phospho-acceptor) domain-containing protein [Rhizobiales bacterium GAS113]|nr:His Kinase A (phospho-acceptor) domain-containing protein [Rhizobiales bacterium GAS113]